MSQIRGRFSKDMDKLVQDYTQSLDVDVQIGIADVIGSMAHARMLAKQGIISKAEGRKITDALKEIAAEMADDKFPLKPELEDIHMNVEARLVEKIGDAGRKLHTARSRNDQVATATRLAMFGLLDAAIDRVHHLQETIVKLAAKHLDTVMPGFTHLQHAQPVLLAHHLLAYFEMLERDKQRFTECVARAGVLPLGSGALAGVSYPIDRAYVARELGFDQVSQNSIDAVSDRDFILEYEFDAALCMMHLSRLAEELVLWSTAEFDFIEMDDTYATGSSIMPQKKNPDVAELARGKTGRVYGNIVALLTTMKGLPLAYNRDMQEDKEGLFDTANTLLSTLDVFNGMLSTLRVKKDNMAKAAAQGYALATDVADYLVKKGEAFRTAHETTAKLVRYAIENGKALDELKLAEYKKFSPRFEKDVQDITLASSIAARNHTGGTARPQVEKQIARARQLLEEHGKDEPQD